MAVGHDPAQEPAQQAQHPHRHPQGRRSSAERQLDELGQRASDQKCPAVRQQAEREGEAAALAVTGNGPRHRAEDSAERGQENQPLVVIAGRSHARPVMVRQESVELSVE